MSTLKTVLLLCSCLSLFFLFSYCASFFRAVFLRLSPRKEPIPWKDFNPFYGCQGSLDLIILIAVIAGFSNIFLSLFYASTKIGAFYEKTSYKEHYDAYVYADDKPIFCIATVYKDGATYSISEISMPYGHSQYVDEIYDPDEKSSTIYLGVNGWRCKITLKEPASSTSYTALKNEVVSNYGAFCGSKESDSYHFVNCKKAKNIKAENFVYFESEQEAEILGYQMCSVCSDRH